MSDKFKSAIARANRSLTKIKIYSKNNHLHLRGTLPPKPGQGDKPKQQWIGTGLPVKADTI